MNRYKLANMITLVILFGMLFSSAFLAVANTQNSNEKIILESYTPKLGTNDTRPAYVKFQNKTGIYETTNGTTIEIESFVEPEWMQQYRDYVKRKNEHEKREKEHQQFEETVEFYFNIIAFPFAILLSPLYATMPVLGNHVVNTVQDSTQMIQESVQDLSILTEEVFDKTIDDFRPTGIGSELPMARFDYEANNTHTWIGNPTTENTSDGLWILSNVTYQEIDIARAGRTFYNLTDGTYTFQNDDTYYVDNQWYLEDEYPNRFILRLTNGSLYRPDTVEGINTVIASIDNSTIWGIGYESIQGVMAFYTNFADTDWGHGQYLWYPRLKDGTISNYDQPLYAMYLHLYAKIGVTWYDKILNDRSMYNSTTSPRNNLHFYNTSDTFGLYWEANDIDVLSSTWDFRNGFKFNFTDMQFHMINEFRCNSRGFDDIGWGYEITQSPQADGTPYEIDQIRISNGTKEITLNVSEAAQAGTYLDDFYSSIDFISILNSQEYQDPIPAWNETFPYWNGTHWNNHTVEHEYIAGFWLNDTYERTFTFTDMEQAGFTEKYLEVHNQTFPDGSNRYCLLAGMYGYGSYTQGDWILVDPSGSGDADDNEDLYRHYDPAVGYTYYDSSTSAEAGRGPAGAPPEYQLTYYVAGIAIETTINEEMGSVTATTFRVYANTESFSSGTEGVLVRVYNIGGNGGSSTFKENSHSYSLGTQTSETWLSSDFTGSGYKTQNSPDDTDLTDYWGQNRGDSEEWISFLFENYLGDTDEHWNFADSQRGTDYDADISITYDPANTAPVAAYYDGMQNTYAGKQFATIRTDHTDADGAPDLVSGYIYLGISGTWYGATWNIDTNTAGEIGSYQGWGSIQSVSETGITNGYRLTWTITLDWDFGYDDTDYDIYVVSYDDQPTSGVSGWQEAGTTTHETELIVYSTNFILSDSAYSEDGDTALGIGEWFRGGVGVKATGYVTYEGTTNVYPPNTAVDVQLWVDNAASTLTDCGATYDDETLATGYFDITSYFTTPSDAVVDENFQMDIVLEDFISGASQGESDLAVHEVDRDNVAPTGGTWTTDTDSDSTGNGISPYWDTYNGYEAFWDDDDTDSYSADASSWTDDSGIDEYRITSTGGSYGSWQASASNVACTFVGEGAKDISYQISDNVGNVASGDTAIDIYFSTVAPTGFDVDFIGISAYTPSVPSYFWMADTTQVTSGDLWYNDGGSSTFTVECDASGTWNAGGEWKVWFGTGFGASPKTDDSAPYDSFVYTSDGFHELSNYIVRIINRNGIHQQLSFPITKDTTNPTLTDTFSAYGESGDTGEMHGIPADDEFWFSNTFDTDGIATFTATGSDGDVGLSGINFGSFGDTGASFDDTSSYQGVYTINDNEVTGSITVTAYDRVGNGDSDTITMTEDPDPPTITVTWNFASNTYAIMTGSDYGWDNIDVTLAQDTVSGLDFVTINGYDHSTTTWQTGRSVDGSPEIYSANNYNDVYWYYTDDGETTGNYLDDEYDDTQDRVYVYGDDFVGNRGGATIYVKLDRTAPSGYSIVMESGTYYADITNDNTPLITASGVVESGSGLTATPYYFAYNIDEGGWVYPGYQAGNTYTPTITDSNNVDFAVSLIDVVGNDGGYVYDLNNRVDLTDPVFTNFGGSESSDWLYAVGATIPTGYYSDNMPSNVDFFVIGDVTDNWGLEEATGGAAFGDTPTDSTITGTSDAISLTYTIDSGYSGTKYPTITLYDQAGNSITDIFYWYHDNTVPPTTTFHSIVESSDYLYWDGSYLWISDEMGDTPQAFTLNVNSSDIDGLYETSGLITNPGFAIDTSGWTKGTDATRYSADGSSDGDGYALGFSVGGQAWIETDITNTDVEDIHELVFYTRFGFSGLEITFTYSDASTSVYTYSVGSSWPSWSKHIVSRNDMDVGKTVDKIKITSTNGVSFENIDNITITGMPSGSGLYAVEFLETAWGDNAPANDTSSYYGREFYVTENEANKTMTIKAVDNVGNWETTLEITIIDESGQAVELGIGVDEILEGSVYLYAPDNTTLYYGDEMSIGIDSQTFDEPGFETDTGSWEHSGGSWRLPSNPRTGTYSYGYGTVAVGWIYQTFDVAYNNFNVSWYSKTQDFSSGTYSTLTRFYFSDSTTYDYTWTGTITSSYTQMTIDYDDLPAEYQDIPVIGFGFQRPNSTYKAVYIDDLVGEGEKTPQAHFDLIYAYNGSSGISHVNTTVSWFGQSYSDSSAPYDLYFDITDSDTQTGTMTIIIWTNAGSNSTDTIIIYRDTATTLTWTAGATSESSAYLYHDGSSQEGFYSDLMGSVQTFTVGGTYTESGGSHSGVLSLVDNTSFGDNPTNVSAGGSWSFAYTIDSNDYSSGTFVVLYTMTDNVGNTNTDTFEFRLDITEPKLIWTSDQTNESSIYLYYDGSSQYGYYSDNMGASTHTFNVGGNASELAITNAIENGGFETGDMTGWTILIGSPITRTHADFKVSGNYGGDLTYDPSEIVQYLNVMVDDIIEFSYYYRDYSATFNVSVYYTDSTKDTWVISTTTGTWTKYDRTSELDAGKRISYVSFARTDSTGTICPIDDIILNYTTQNSGISSIVDNTTFGDNPSASIGSIYWSFAYDIDSGDSGDGSFNVTYTITDNVGNTNSTWFYFYIDNTNPVIALDTANIGELSPFLYYDGSSAYGYYSDNMYSVLHEYNISSTATDSIVGVDTSRTSDNTTFGDNPSNTGVGDDLLYRYQIDYSDDSFGTFTVLYRIYDYVNNTDTVEFEFRLDNDDPIIAWLAAQTNESSIYHYYDGSSQNGSYSGNIPTVAIDSENILLWIKYLTLGTTSIVDSSDYARSLTIDWQEGEVFDGSYNAQAGYYIDTEGPPQIYTAHDAVFHSSSFTIGFWFYMDSTGAGSANHYIMEKLNAFGLGVDEGGRACFNVDGTEIESDVMSTSAWHFIVGSFDGTTATLYVDGDIESSSLVTYTPTGTNAFYTMDYFDQASGGKIDDQFFLNQSLTLPQVAILYNNMPSMIIGVSENPFNVGGSSSDTGSGLNFIWNNISNTNLILNPSFQSGSGNEADDWTWNSPHRGYGAYGKEVGLGYYWDFSNWVRWVQTDIEDSVLGMVSFWVSRSPAGILRGFINFTFTDATTYTWHWVGPSSASGNDHHQIFCHFDSDIPVEYRDKEVDTIRWYSQDAVDGSFYLDDVAAYSYIENATDTQTGSSDLWSIEHIITSYLYSGNYNVSYTLFDNVGNNVFDWFYFYEDITAPTIQLDTGEIEEDSPYLYYDGSSAYGFYSDNMGASLVDFIINGSSTDAGSGLQFIVDNITGWGDDPVNTGTLAEWMFVYQIDSSDTGSLVTYTITDNVNNTNTVTFYFYEDTTAPTGTFTLTQDPDALVSNWDNDTDANTVISGASDGASPPASGINTTHTYTYQLDSGGYGEWNTTTNKAWITTEGTRTLYITIADNCNNTQEYSITIYVDLTYPTLDSLTWKNPSYSDNWYKYLDNFAQFNVTWTESNPYLLNATQSGVSYEELDSSPSGSLSDFEIAILASPEGIYDVTVEIWDNAGNYLLNVFSDDADKLKLDNSAPTGNFELDQHVDRLEDNYHKLAIFTTTLSGHTDNGPSGGSGLPTDFIRYQLNGGGYTDWESTTGESWIGVDQFNNTLYCYLRDNVGLESTIYLDWVIVDIIAPVLGWLVLNETWAPNWYDQAVSTTAQASINWVEKYPFDVDATCTLAHTDDNGLDETASPYSGNSKINFTLTGEADGSYSVSIRIRDKAGNEDTTLAGSEAPIQLNSGMSGLQIENWFYFYFFKNDATGLDWRDFNTSYVLDEDYRNYTEVRMRGALYAQKYLNLTSGIRFIVRNYFGDVISNESYTLPTSFDLYITLDVNTFKIANLYDEVMNMTIERTGSSQVFTEQIMPNEIWDWDMYAATYNITVYIHDTTTIALERDGTSINDFLADLSLDDYAMFVDAPLTFNTLNMIISEIWQFNILSNKDHKSLQPTVNIYMNGTQQGTGDFSPGTIVLSRPTYGYYNLTVYATWMTYTATYQRWITVESNAEVTTWTTGGQVSTSEIISIAWNTNKGTGTLRVYDNGSLIATDSVEGALTIVKSSVVGLHNLTMNITVETKTFTAYADYTISDWSATVTLHLYSEASPYVSVSGIHTATVAVTRSDDETFSGYVTVNGSAVSVINGVGSFSVVNYDIEQLVYNVGNVQDILLTNRSYIANDLTVTFDRLIGSLSIVDITSSSGEFRVTFNNSYDNLMVSNFDYAVYIEVGGYETLVKTSRESTFTITGLGYGTYTVSLDRINNLDNNVNTGTCNEVSFSIDAPPALEQQIQEDIVEPFGIPIILVLIVIGGIVLKSYLDRKEQQKNGGSFQQQMSGLLTQQKQINKGYNDLVKRNGR